MSASVAITATIEFKRVCWRALLEPPIFSNDLFVQQTLKAIKTLTFGF